MSFLKPAQLGLVEHVTFSVPWENGEVWAFMVPKPDAERLKALATRRSVSAEQVVAEWLLIRSKRPSLSDEEIKSYRPKDISGCSHGLPPTPPPPRSAHLDHLLAFALSLALLLTDIFDYWQ
jgi:hypothetical protein